MEPGVAISVTGDGHEKYATTLAGFYGIVFAKTCSITLHRWSNVHNTRYSGATVSLSSDMKSPVFYETFFDFLWKNCGVFPKSGKESGVHERYGGGALMCANGQGEPLDDPQTDGPGNSAAGCLAAEFIACGREIKADCGFGNPQFFTDPLRHQAVRAEGEAIFFACRKAWDLHVQPQACFAGLPFVQVDANLAERSGVPASHGREESILTGYGQNAQFSSQAPQRDG
ncbi:hypothetical protein OQ252_08790 [Acetobacter farinalis]|uniref:Uncharacterized protein n=1 Tax=Acetobacter farinalis TaxID=1260984 RepID=A0ABT3Q866_9PROT|nr:hypothetical protein [Acetobacter farinalis]MCX2561488.1 hypothetical protein [Acetobacter farinalis]